MKQAECGAGIIQIIISWDNIDYNKLGLAWYKQYNFNSVEMLNQADISDKYLFATEYV